MPGPPRAILTLGRVGWHGCFCPWDSHYWSLWGWILGLGKHFLLVLLHRLKCLGEHPGDYLRTCRSLGGLVLAWAVSPS